MKYTEVPRTDGDGFSAVVKAIDSLRDEIGQRHTENTSTLEVLEQDLKIAIARVDDLAKGFPGGDPAKHCEYHESLIARNKAREQFWVDLRTELAKKGLWAIVIGAGAAVWWLLGLVWIYVKAKVTH